MIPAEVQGDEGEDESLSADVLVKRGASVALLRLSVPEAGSSWELLFHEIVEAGESIVCKEVEWARRVGEWCEFLVRERGVNPMASLHTPPFYHVLQNRRLGKLNDDEFLVVMHQVLRAGLRWHAHHDVDVWQAFCRAPWRMRTRRTACLLFDFGYGFPHTSPPDTSCTCTVMNRLYLQRLATRRTAMALLTRAMLKSPRCRVVGRDVMRYITQMVWAQRFAMMDGEVIDV